MGTMLYVRSFRYCKGSPVLLLCQGSPLWPRTLLGATFPQADPDCEFDCELTRCVYVTYIISQVLKQAGDIEELVEELKAKDELIAELEQEGKASFSGLTV